MANAKMLSHQCLRAMEIKMPKSFSICLSLHNSTIVEVRAQYSDSVEDLETMACFLTLQVIGL